MSSTKLVSQVRQIVHKHDHAALRALFSVKPVDLVAAATALIISDEPPADAARVLAGLRIEDAAHVIEHLAPEAAGFT